jgi:transposase-like zinc ribbon protein
MEDYPRNLVEFDERFASEEAWIAYLMSLRWPKGFVCPKCGGNRAWRGTRLAMVCARCRHETSITAGTLFEKTHKPLRVWFKAMWSVTSQKTGASALGLQRVLGLGSYETAWLWLHKLRPAMVRPGRDRLKGWVEVDETYVGGPEEGSRGRQTDAVNLDFVRKVVGKARAVSGAVVCRTPNSFPLVNGFQALPASEL